MTFSAKRHPSGALFTRWKNDMAKGGVEAPIRLLYEGQWFSVKGQPVRQVVSHDKRRRRVCTQDAGYHEIECHEDTIVEGLTKRHPLAKAAIRKRLFLDSYRRQQLFLGS